MNVAVLCFHTLGGSGVVAGELGRELARRGHEVHFISAALPGRLEPKPDGIFLHQVPLEAPPPLGSQAFPLLLAAQLTEVVRTRKIDLIHAHYALPHAAAALLARATLGAAAPPLLLTLHGSDVPEHAPEGMMMLLRRLAKEAAAITVPSASLAARARERLSQQQRFEVIPNFVDVERFSPGPSRPSGRVLFHASNFRPVKRPVDLVRIFARVRKQMRATLVLAGDGPERPRVEEEVRSLGLSEDVRFAGTPNDLLPLLRAADLFLLPSASESFGLAALEALACGVPVVGSRTGGLPEVVGDAGALYEPGDVDAMALAAVRILGDIAEHSRLRKLARDRAVQFFAAPPLLERWEALYHRISKENA
jgi:N-acetyl-alpha-D-glucosaminyl L-malate synthase BshA